jgi:hypothetical protein
MLGAAQKGQIVIDLVLSALMIVSAVPGNRRTSEGIVDCNIVQACHNTVHIQFLPEMELFQVICYLSGAYRGITLLEFEYKSDIEKRFGGYRNHPAVTVTRELIGHHYAENLIKAYILNDEFRDDTAHLDLLHLEDDSEPKGSRDAKLRAIDGLRAACRQFAEDSRFKEFYDKRKPYYLKKVREVQTALEGLSVIAPREAFWGMKKDVYRIVIVLLERDVHSCWFRNDGLWHSIYLLTPKFAVDDDAKFGNSTVSSLSEGKLSAADYIYYGSGHEFGHSFLNPLTQTFADQINAISFDFRKSGQPTKTDFLNESILRAYTAYELARHGKGDAAQMVVQSEQMNGYIYNDAILQLLQHYDANRDRYKRFDDFLPYLLAELSKRIN